jgi:hypothetical protein
MLTRSSRSQTFKQFQLVTEPYRSPLILEDFPDQRPLLMMLDQREYEKEKERYEHLLEGSDLIYSEGDRLRLYRLPLRSFRERLEAKTARLERMIQGDSSLIWSAGLASRDTIARYHYDDLAEGEPDRYYFGQGGWQGTCAGDNRFTIPNLPGQTMGEDYVLSIWLYLADDRRTRSRVELIEKAPDGAEIRRQGGDAHHLIDVFDPAGWGLIEMGFQPSQVDSYFELTIRNARLGSETLFLDELLVRPQAVAVYGRGAGYWWFNNRHYPISN